MNKRDKRFRNSSCDVIIKNVKNILEDNGYKLISIRGSHFRFRKHKSIVIPVHNNKVKCVYVKEIIKIIYNER